MEQPSVQIISSCSLISPIVKKIKPNIYWRAYLIQKKIEDSGKLNYFGVALIFNQLLSLEKVCFFASCDYRSLKFDFYNIAAIKIESKHHLISNTYVSPKGT